MAVPSQATQTAGATLTAAYLNDDVRDAVNFLTNVPAVKVYNTVNWKNWSASGSLFQTTWDSEAYDTNTMHSTSVNTERITFTTAGVYEIATNLRVVAPGVAWSNSGRISIEVRLNAGATVIYESVTNPNAANVASAHQFRFNYKFAAADYIELWAGYTDGGVASINPALTGTEKDTFMVATWAGTGA